MRSWQACLAAMLVVVVLPAVAPRAHADAPPTSWATYQTAFCGGLLLDLPGVPLVAYAKLPLGNGQDIEVMTLTLASPPGALVYACRVFPAYAAMGMSDGDIALRILDVEVPSFGDGWTRGETDYAHSPRIATALTGADGSKVTLWVTGSGQRADRSFARSHTLAAVKVPDADATRFGTSLREAPPPTKEPIEVRSGECGSRVTMPRWPSEIDGDARHSVLALRDTSTLPNLEESADRDLALRLHCYAVERPDAADAALFDEVEKTILGKQVSVFRVVSRKDVTIDGRPGRETRYATWDDNTQWWMRLAKDKALVQAASFYGPTPDAAARGEAFLASFHLLR